MPRGAGHEGSTSVLVEIPVRAFASSHGERLASVDLYINAECNLSCTTCFLGDDYFTGDRMAVAHASGVLRWAADRGIKDVAILGGEPTLHPQLSTILAAARSSGFDSIRLVSNGSARLRRLIRGSAREFVDLVYLSLDGHDPASHDAVRGVGSYADVTRSMDLLVRLNMPFVLTMTVTRSSLSSIDRVLRLADGAGAAAVNIHWLSPVGRAADGAMTLTADEWISACQVIEAFVPSRDTLHVYYQPAFASPIQSSMAVATQCAVRSESNLQFMPDGHVHACGLTVDRPELSGYVWRGGEVLRSPPSNEVDLCDAHLGPGCPLRVSQESGATADWLPICIYARVHAQKSARLR